ncbi:hypothetical protein EAS68_06180 [Legionella jordanis]|uniref:hypothetical protein n=1 Tax=Legionella jordanis TaxID=456 RepID=UPI000EFEFF98|nr:hypothetical protein [Legionella jordanis]RMX20901.1 hypothetical protein EAS68_06180 [Legionella jordanis]
MNTVKRNYLILFLLLLLFAAPGLIAYICYNHPQWLGSTQTNKGELLTPPPKFLAISQNAKWRLIFWYPGDCSSECMMQLDKVARIRLALGRRLYQVEQWLILDEQAAALSPQFASTLKEQDIAVLRLNAKSKTEMAMLESEAKIFIANPDDYLVLAYKANAKPDDIFHDLKHLLSLDKRNA